MGLIVYWTRFAENKLDKIFDYYESKVSGGLAQNLVNGILDRTIGLEQNPQIGQEEELIHDRQQKFRYLVYKNYKIIYWINQRKDRIEISNVFDCRQNPEKINENS